MKIYHKINILILISIFALLGIFVLSAGFKTRELRYHTLAEEVKRLQVSVLNALVHEKNFEKTYKDEALVYTSLDKATQRLDKIEVSLLRDNQKTGQIENLLGQFKTSFAKMVQNSNELLSIKEKINRFARDYSREHLKADKKILRMIANSYLYEKMDIIALKEKVYNPLSKQLTLTYAGLEQQIPLLRKSFIKNLEISKQLQNNENQISIITESIAKLSESIRLENSKKASLMQILGQAVIIGFLLIGGFLLGRSITKPLSLLTRATEAMKPGSEDEKQLKTGDSFIDTQRNDEHEFYCF